jgi:hypothetical protein
LVDCCLASVLRTCKHVERKAVPVGAYEGQTSAALITEPDTSDRRMLSIS